MALDIRYMNNVRRSVNSNYTNRNNLGLISEKKPYQMKPILEGLFSAQHNYSGNAFSSLIGNNKMTIKGTDYEYKVAADDFKPLVITKSIGNIGEFVGTGGTMFDIEVDVNFYLPSDVIVPLRGNNSYQCRIQDGPIATAGGKYIYKVQYVKQNGQGIPAELFQVGQEWARMWATASEADIQGGSVQFGGYYTLYGKTGKVRLQHEITDYAHEMILAANFVQDGKRYSTWLPAIEAKMIKQFEMDKERLLVYGVSNDNVSSAVGYTVDTFPGVVEQLETSGNNFYYNRFSVKLLEEYLADIYFSRVSPGEVKEITVLTGYWGMVQASEAMNKLVQENNSWKFVGTNFNPAKAVTSFHPNSYSYGYTFSQYISSMGIKVNFVHMPLFDDRRFNRQVDPITGRYVESMRYLFLDFKGDNGTNIKKIEVEGTYGFSYVRGVIGPEGRNHGKNPANTKESYSIHMTEQLGVMIEDISNCGMLVYQPNGLL